MFGVALSFFVFPVLASTPPPITGGVETDALPAVVALVGVKPDITWDLCTATLIDPYVALTAAHCIEGMENADGYDFELRVGSGLGEPDESFPLDGWIIHPDGDVDMALLFLAEPALTSPLPPFPEQLAVDGPEELAKLVG